jgi:hypothetical protein
MPHRFRVACPAIGVALVLGLAGAASAQKSPALDRASLWVGGFDARSRTLLHARTPDGSQYGDVQLENNLGFPHRDWTPRLRAEVLVGDSQGLSFDFFRYRREHAATLPRRVLYNGITYDTHTRVHGWLGFDFGSAAYRWWFGKGDDVVGFGVGAGYYRVEASVLGQATVNGMSGLARASTNENAWAPLLQLGWRHAFGDHWRLYFDASGVKKNGGRLHGHAFRAALGAQWFPAGRLGISAEYGVQRIRLWQHHASYDDSLDLQLDGPSVYVTLRF